MLINKTRNKIVVRKVKLANDYLTKLRGLMFENKEKFNYALVFDLRGEHKLSASIHMLFVFFPIDVLYLDRNKKVVQVVRNLKPFTPLFVPEKHSAYIVEIPTGKSKGIGVGDQLGWT
jgi:uncharacterized membrane protein (UPF0127 family)